MKILVICDIDDLNWKYGSGQADVLLSCGDVCEKVILEAAEAYGVTVTYAIKGNHDRYTPFSDPIVDLHRTTQEYGGLQFGGLNGSWKYKPRGHFLYDQQEIDGFLSSFPSVDIFISHNSPRGVHDRDDGVHYGFEGLNSYMKKARPKVLIHGHQHIDAESIVFDTRVICVYGHRVIEV